MRHGTRHGYTLLELLVVLAILIIIGFLVLPTLTGQSGNTKIEAGADVIRTAVADAHSLAIEHGEPYRLAISNDGTKIRMGPDTDDFATLPVGQSSGGSSTQRVVEEPLPQHVTARVVPADGQAPPAQSGDWTTIATFLPTGICREVTALIKIEEPTSRPIQIRVRGDFGSAETLPSEDQKP